MASGNSLVAFEPTDNRPPAANYATPDERNGHPVLDFDAAAAESAIFASVLPRHYGGGGLTARIAWMASTATSGNVLWTVGVERDDAALDLDADSFATAVSSAAIGAAGTSGFPVYTDIPLTSGAQIDSLAIGEHFRLRVTRDAAAGGDTMAGDAELLSVELRET
jgi:hypothetical protein